jgi:hypothetical protein
MSIVMNMINISSDHKNILAMAFFTTWLVNRCKNKAPNSQVNNV